MSRPPQHKPGAGENTSESNRATERRSDRRASVVDRRSGLDRRDTSSDESGESVRYQSNLERRRGPGRRRTDFMKAAEEGEMTKEQFMFVMAIDAFKQANDKTFPSWTDVLEVIRKLGYRKTMHSTLNLGNRVEDWIERADAEDGVSKVTPLPGEEHAEEK